MRISQKTIDEIFNIAIIEEVISEFVMLKKTGANYKGLSPHNKIFGLRQTNIPQRDTNKKWNGLNQEQDNS